MLNPPRCLSCRALLTPDTEAFRRCRDCWPENVKIGCDCHDAPNVRYFRDHGLLPVDDPPPQAKPAIKTRRKIRTVRLGPNPRA
jgi:hypothetical protein